METAIDLNIHEALDVLRFKDVRSTTLERLRVTWEADARVQGLPQPLQLGQGLYHLLDQVPVPVAAHDLLLGRMPERVPNEQEEAFYRACLAQWDGRAIPPWMRDGGHECFAWDRLLRLGLPGLELYAGERLAEQLRKRPEWGEEGAHGGWGARLDYLRGAIRVYQAFRRYARRYAEAAYEAGKNSGYSFQGYGNGKYDAPEEYKRVHDEVFLHLTRIMMRYGYHDLYLMDPVRGTIFFTVDKKPDFGTETDAIGSHLRSLWHDAAQEGSHIGILRSVVGTGTLFEPLVRVRNRSAAELHNAVCKQVGMIQLFCCVKVELCGHGILHRTFDNFGPQPVLIIGKPLTAIGSIQQFEQFIDIHSDNFYSFSSH